MRKGEEQGPEENLVLLEAGRGKEGTEKTEMERPRRLGKGKIRKLLEERSGQQI